MTSGIQRSNCIPIQRTYYNTFNARSTTLLLLLYRDALLHALAYYGTSTTTPILRLLYQCRNLELI